MTAAKVGAAKAGATKVVDASAIAAVVFGEPEASVVRPLIGNAALLAPAHLPYEMTNIYVKKARARSVDAVRLDLSFRTFLRMPIRLLDVEHRAVATLAQAAGLTAYDASYLWLSRVLDAELVTLDKALIAAASR